MRVLFTGFEPFGKHEYNPSATAAEAAAEAASATCEVLPVGFDTATQSPPVDDYDLVVHLGIAASTPYVRLERYAHNLRVRDDDPAQEFDPDAVVPLAESGPIALETAVDVGLLRRELQGSWDIRHSRDAGTYVCNATYYWSLEKGHQAVFVHVPEFTPEEAARFGADLGRAVLLLSPI